jgi:hypothetical protein
MWSEMPPFGNLALCEDTDRVYHRIGAIGNGNTELPQMSACATIQPDADANRTVLKKGDVRAITQAVPFGFPYSGKLKFATKSRSPTI